MATTDGTSRRARKIDDCALAELIGKGRDAGQLRDFFQASVQSVYKRAERLGLLNDLQKNGQTRPLGAKQTLSMERRYGLPMDEIKALRVNGAFQAFAAQKSNAHRRGIDWGLTLAQWWTIWSDSGHWHERGVGSGKFVMARSGDCGPYAEGNVHICTHNQNAREIFQNKPGLAQRAAAASWGYAEPGPQVWKQRQMARLTCAHCGCEFEPSKRQYERHRASGPRNCCCSDTCRFTLLSRAGNRAKKSSAG
jgi:hypothetical protein